MDFSETSSYCSNDLKRIILYRSRFDRFVPELSPYVTFLSMLSTEILISATPPTKFSRDFNETFQLLFTLPEDVHILSRSCSTDVLPELWPFNNFSTVNFFSATPLAVFSGF